MFESGVRFGFQKGISLVFLISFIALGVTQVVLYVDIGILGWEMLLTKICATGAVFFGNFGARSQFIFKPLADTQKNKQLHKPQYSIAQSVCLHHSFLATKKMFLPIGGSRKFSINRMGGTTILS